MMRVFLLVSALQQSSGVLLGKESQESNSSVTRGLKQWLNFGCIVKTGWDVGNHYKQAVYVHMKDVADLQDGKHDEQQALAPLAAGHPYAYAFVNINLAAAEHVLVGENNAAVDRRVREAQRQFAVDNWQNMLKRAGVKELGKQAKKMVGDNLVKARHGADVKILKYYKDKVDPVITVAQGNQGLVHDMQKHMGLNHNGLAAFIDMMNQLEIDKPFMLTNGGSDFVTVSDELADDMAQANWDKKEVYAGLEALTQGLQQKRDEIGAYRQQFLKLNFEGSMDWVMNGRGDVAEQLFKKWLMMNKLDHKYDLKENLKQLHAANEDRFNHLPETRDRDYFFGYDEISSVNLKDLKDMV